MINLKRNKEANATMYISSRQNNICRILVPFRTEIANNRRKFKESCELHGINKFPVRSEFSF